MSHKMYIINMYGFAIEQSPLLCPQSRSFYSEKAAIIINMPLKKQSSPI